MVDGTAHGSGMTTLRRDRFITLALVSIAHIAALIALLTIRPDGVQRIAELPMQLITIRPLQPPAPTKRPSPPPQPRKNASPPARRAARPQKRLSVIAPVAIAATDADLSVSVGRGELLASIGTGLDLGIGTGVGSAGLSRHAEWVGGGIGNRDYPEAAKIARLQGVVDVRFTVLTDGRVRGCGVDHSSSSAELDRLTCALVEQRLLYNPALDASGKPVEEVAGRRFRFVMSPRR
jgi:protein TonB